jgi:hypothetical protein
MLLSPSDVGMSGIGVAHGSEVDMEAAGIAEEITSLPPEAQEQVMDFVAFLKSRYSAKRPAAGAKPAPLAEEPFIGMWRGRDEMSDSTAWVRDLRRRDWGPGQ